MFAPECLCDRTPPNVHGWTGSDRDDLRTPGVERASEVEADVVDESVESELLGDCFEKQEEEVGAGKEEVVELEEYVGVPLQESLDTSPPSLFLHSSDSSRG